MSAAGGRCVTHISTDLAAFSVTPQGMVVEEIAPGLSLAEVQHVTEAALRPGSRLAAHSAG